MSILINMEMPNKKNGAVLIIYPDGKCAFEDGKTYQAVPVPPHGDLIDIEAFLATQREIYCENCKRCKGIKNGEMRFVYDVGDAPCRACDIRDVLDALEDAPTIVQAEEG